MNRRKPAKRSGSQPREKRQPDRKSKVQPAVSATEDSASRPRSDGGEDGLPSSAVRSILSIWLPLHLFAIFISFSAVVEPSGLHVSLQNLLRPYLQLTHFDADDRLVYLAHGEDSERAHRLQVSENEITNIEAGSGEDGWTTIGPRGKVLREEAGRESVPSLAAHPGLAESDRYARWLTTAATLSENEQPGLVAELLLPLVRADESIGSIRIARLLNDLNTTVDESLPPPYIARVVRRGEDVALVQLQPARLSAVAPLASSATDNAAEGRDENTAEGTDDGTEDGSENGTDGNDTDGNATDGNGTDGNGEGDTDE